MDAAGTPAPRRTRRRSLCTSRLIPHAVSSALLALVGALLWSAPAEAHTAIVLISNTGQTTNTGSYPLTDTFNKLAQSFTAGTNGTGYTVDSVASTSLASPTQQLREPICG